MTHKGISAIDTSKNNYVVILAGGSGTRFWPRSRRTHPKQLCAVGSLNHTLLEETLDRLDGFVPPSRRLIVTHMDQVALTKDIVGNRCEHFIAEPEARNTSAALTLAALQIRHMSEDPDNAVMISLHADHLIQNIAQFRNSLETAVELAKENQLVLLGVSPKYPETGYGYIEIGPALSQKNCYRVESFREKPELELAKQYLESGNYLWNSGLFVWKVKTLLEEVDAYLPTISSTLQEAMVQEHSDFCQMASSKLVSYYKKLPKVAIDHGVLEVSQRVSVVRTDFDWQDIGSWDALTQCFPPDEQGNLGNGDVLFLETKNTTVDTDGHFVATLGVQDLVVVVAKGAVLVCPKDRCQDVKKIVTELEARNRNDLL